MGTRKTNELSLAWSHVVYEGINLSIQFQRFPEVLRRIEEWNSKVNTVDGRQLQKLGSATDTLSSEWFKQLDDLSKLRVLFYYNYPRRREQKLEHYARTGKFPDAEYYVGKQEEFTAALHTSKEAEVIWARATADHRLDPPL